MKPKDLLFQLSHLESHLNDFSLEKLNTDEAEHLKLSFRAFKQVLLDKIAPTREKRGNASPKIPKKTILDFEKSANGPNLSIPSLDLETYDAIIEHHKSYGAVLKSLKIESAMKAKKQSTSIFNKSMSSVERAQTTIDLNPVLEECMGELDLLTELIRLFERNALEFIGAAKIYLPTSDFKRLGLAAHKVKAGLAMMKTDSLHSIILQVENVCNKDQDIKHLQFLCNCFNAEFPEVQRAMNEAFETLRKNKY